MDEALRSLGISLTHAAALMHLERQPGLSGAELARRLLITPQSTATLLAQMEKKGWILRSAHPVHRTLIEVVITKEGRLAMSSAFGRISEIDARITRDLSSSDLRILHQGLDSCLVAAQDVLAALRSEG